MPKIGDFKFLVKKNSSDAKKNTSVAKWNQPFMNKLSGVSIQPVPG